MVTTYSYDRRIAGHMPWSAVNILARRLDGSLDRAYQSKAPAAQDTQWNFMNEVGYKAFVHAMQKEHMSFKADPKGMSVVVWF